MASPVSCDTFVVLPSSTKKNVLIFGKNSDRPNDEVQEIIYEKRQTYTDGCQLKCTYIEIEQVNETNAVIVSKPEWMWGAEMGANEHGVVIGNEAIWTKVMKESREKRLLGMDLVRLGLERSNTALNALHVITELLKKYGQGGSCSENEADELYYQNSFLIADKNEAWILETVGREWAAEKITTGYRNISNCLTIETKIDLMSENLKALAINEQLWNGDDEFNFTKIFSASGQASGCQRFVDGKKLLSDLSQENNFDIYSMMKILRDSENGICRDRNHSFPTQGSQISILSLKRPSCHWFTGTPDPSKSVYKPFIFGENIKFSDKVISLRNLVATATKTTSKEKEEEEAAAATVDDKEKRKHQLYRKQEICYQNMGSDLNNLTKLINTLRDVERNCINEIEETLDNFNEKGDLLIDDLFSDSVEAELRFYR